MSIIRIIRLSALEAWWLRVGAWWAGLTSRERWLVGTLGGLLAAVVLVFGVVKPLQAARAEALADIRTYETLTARVRAAGTLTPGAARPVMRSEAPVPAVEAIAREAGLTVTVTPDLTATVADAPYEAVIGWIATVERTTPLRAQRVDLRKGGAAGRVIGSVVFA